MTDEGCSAVTSALKSNPSHLRELNLSGNKLGDSGVKNLSDLLMNPQFKLEKLQLVLLYSTAGPDWLIGSTGRIPIGPICFFGREGWCCHATGLKKKKNFFFVTYTISFKFYLSHTRLYRDCITSSEM